MSIRIRYEKELQDIFGRLVDMCRQIEKAIEKCVKALTERDFELAREVLAEDDIVDEMEREIETKCFRLLMMESPVARDFRDVSAALKMITDLERIGDQAKDIADITAQFGDEKYTEKLENIPEMATIVIQMVKDSVQSYINRDLELARSLEETDDKVDTLFVKVMNDCVKLTKKNPDNVEQAIMLMMINKYLERIGDHAVNIGEWVEFAITGVHPKKIKHRKKDGVE